MNLIDYVMPVILTCLGIILGSVVNYFILKRLFKGQVTSIIGIFEGTKMGEEISEMIHRLSEFSKSEEAKVLLKKLEKALTDLTE